MTVTIIAVAALLAYSFLVSQPFMYIIALKNVQRSMNAASYIELRKLLDRNFRSTFKYVVYTSLLVNILLLIVAAAAANALLVICAAISFSCLIADILLMQKGNIPINTIINTWDENNYPVTWQSYRRKWLLFFKYRQRFSIAGFIALCIGVACS